MRPFRGEDIRSKDLEQKGLAEVGESGQFDKPVVRQQVWVQVKGASQGRKSDGLAENPDGTYAGVEVKPGQANRAAGRMKIDRLVARDKPATASPAPSSSTSTTNGI